MAAGADVASRVKSRPTTSAGRLPTRPPTPVRRPSLVAASRKIDLRTRDGIKLVRKPETWQKESWAFFRSVPPLTFGGSYKGSALSRVRPYPAIVLNPDEPPVALADAAESDEPEAAGITPAIAEAAEAEFARLSNARGGIPALMSAATVGLTIAGECYLVGWPATATEEERWGVYSSSAIDVRSGQVTVKERAGGGKGEPLPEEAFLARIWCADPEWPGDPWSNMRSALGAAEEYVIWARVFRAIAKSGANGGILTMPTELDQEAPVRAGDEEGPQDELTELQRSLVDYVTESIESDDTVAAAAPWVLDGAAEFLDRVKWINTTRSIDQKVLERLDVLKGEFAHGVDLPVEVIKGLGEVNHWCVDDETEALTSTGWKRHADLSIGDLALTLNHETGMSEWQPVEHIYRAAVADEPMLLLDGMGHSSHTTLGHRWPVIRPRWANGDPKPYDSREFTTSGGLGPEHRIPTAAMSADAPVDPKWSDDLVELMGWFWTEGSIGRSSNTSIVQSHSRNPQNVERIRAALTRLYGPARASLRCLGEPGWREARRDSQHASAYGGPVTVFHLNQEASLPLLAHAPGKVVDLAWVLSLTPSQLRLFTDVSEMGDGRHYRQGHSDIWQRDPEMLGGYELALILQGRMVTRTVSEGGETTSVWRKSTVRPVKASQARDARAVAERTSYTGVVWCPTTRNGTWFARRRGTHYFTGNSAWQVSDDTYKAHLEPTGQVFVQGLASAFLRPGLEGDDIDPAVLRRIVVGLDPSGLVARPNRAADAKELHAKGVLSDEALLRYLAFADADAPEDEELLRRYALDRGVGGVNLTTAVMNRTITAGDPLEVAPEAPAAGEVGTGEGDPTPPEEGGEPVPATLPAAAQVLPVAWAPPALTAAAEGDEDDDPWLLLGLALARIESRLLDRLTVAASDDASEALRKAGSRLKSQAQGNATTRDRVRDVAPEDVAKALGPELVAAMADPATLLAGSLERLAGRWDAWVAAAQAQVADHLSRLADLAPDPAGAKAAIEAFRDAAPAARADGWAEAERQMNRLLGDRLTSNVIDLVEGEGDPASHVPAGLLRDALTRAGGGTPGAGPSGSAQHSGPPGLTTGPTVRRLLDALGATVMAWRWDHGMPAHPFKPHQDLDGVEFDRWDDPRLAGPASWPPVAHLHPGDHRGCQCHVVPVINGKAAGDRPADPGAEAAASLRSTIYELGDESLTLPEAFARAQSTPVTRYGLRHGTERTASIERAVDPDTMTPSVETVDLDGMFTTQASVNPHYIVKLYEDPLAAVEYDRALADEFPNYRPEVARAPDGTLVLVDGHHRGIAEAARSGTGRFTANVYDVDPSLTAAAGRDRSHRPHGRAAAVATAARARNGGT